MGAQLVTLKPFKSPWRSGTWVSGSRNGSASLVLLCALTVAVPSGCIPSSLRREIAGLRRDLRHMKRKSAQNAEQIAKLSDQIFLLQDRVDANRVALSRRRVPSTPVHPESAPSRGPQTSEKKPTASPNPTPPPLPVVRVRPTRERPVLRLTGSPEFHSIPGPGIKEPPRERLPVAPAPPIPRFSASRAISLYQRAMALYRGGHYERALKQFRAFVTRYRTHDYADNALFWQGQCLYRLARFEEAARTFRRVLKEYPSGNKVPDALFKLGLTYFKLGKKREARHALGQVVSLYPGSRLARAAAKYLRQRE